MTNQAQQSYPKISIEDFLKIIRVDEWEDRDGNTPLSERVCILNKIDPSYRDQELILTEELLRNHANNIDAIAAARLIWYLSEARHNRRLLFNLLRKCIFNESIPAEGKAVFTLYLLKNYPQDFGLLIKEKSAAWSRFLSNLNNAAPLQVLRIQSHLDKEKATSIALSLLLSPKNENRVTDTLIELLHEDRPTDVGFKHWLIQLIETASTKIGSFNRKTLKKELSRFSELNDIRYPTKYTLFKEAQGFYTSLVPMQNYRRSQIKQPHENVLSP